jgi:activator of HSP90 ATPase
MSKTIKITRHIKADPDEIYRALVNAFSLELWTGEQAEMSEEPGSEFSIFGGSIIGINIEFITDKKIVQKWYFGEDTLSDVSITLTPEKGKTKVEVFHEGVPEEAYENMLEGWKDTYLALLTAFFED